jgi:hypothetical protein
MIGLRAGRRIPFSDVFQVAGAIAAAAVLKIVAQGHPGFVLGDFASNGFGDLSPGQYNLLSCAIHRDPSYLLFRAGHYGGHVRGGPGQFRTARDRPNLDPHSPHRQSGAQHRPGDLRGQSLCRSALVLLGGANLWRLGGRHRKCDKAKISSNGMVWIKPKNDGAVPLTARQAFPPAIGLRKRGLAERSTNIYRSFTVCAIPIRAVLLSLSSYQREPG